MVTNGFDFDPKKPLMTQVSMMDWGITEIYELKIDYIQVDLVKVGAEGTHYGEPLIYRPDLKDAGSYAVELIPNQEATIDSSLPEESLAEWCNESEPDQPSVVQVDQTKTVLLSWDFSQYRGQRVTEGQLELSTSTLLRSTQNRKDFGEVRISEIRDIADPWDKSTVTYATFVGDNEFTDIVVSQCIIDTKVNPEKKGKTVVTVSQPVMQRLIDGGAAGIAVMPLGLISASFYGCEEQDLAPKLRFSIE